MDSHKHRAEQPSRSGIRTALITVAALLVIFGIAAGVASTGVFRARNLTVTGGGELEVEQILAAGGVSDQTNLIYFSPSRVADRLKANPWIASATVTRTLPDTLAITIVERVPAAVTVRSGDTVLIASDGTSLEEQAKDRGLPSIRGVKPGALGESPQPMRGPAAVASAFGESVLAERPVINVEPDGQIEMDLKKDVVVIYGDATDTDAKALAIAGILAWADENKADIISMDVRVPYAPTAEMERNGQPFDSGIIPLSPGRCDEKKHDREQTEEASPSPSPSPSPGREKKDCPPSDRDRKTETSGDGGDVTL